MNNPRNLVKKRIKLVLKKNWLKKVNLHHLRQPKRKKPRRIKRKRRLS